LTGDRKGSPRKKQHVRSVRESHPNGYLKVNCLTHALPDFSEPTSGIRAVNHAP
jgi:hypothetical protein